MKSHRIEHPDWLAQWDPETFLKLYRAGRIPPPIDSWMAVTTLRHGLRCIYTTNLRAAWGLLILALCDRWDWNVRDPIQQDWYRLRHFYVSAVYRSLQLMRCPVDLGRRESPEPVRCDCGWAGRRRDATHDYQDDGTGQNEVEPVDACPRCGQEV